MASMSAVVRISETFAAIRTVNPVFNAFVDLAEDRACRQAALADQASGAGQCSGVLAGMPFAVKNLFDVRGLPTLAGSRINRELPPAAEDATLVRRLQACGAILVGTLNMDEYASGFTTENSHYGPTRNPHDPARVAGGSSGGSAAAVAAGLVPLALGSDTNGSIRVPASFCGVWGLKPTYGRLSRAGAFPLAASLDTVGPLACSVEVLAAAYDAMQGPDPRDPACRVAPAEPVLPRIDSGTKGLRIGYASGYFETNAEPAVVDLVRHAAAALGARNAVEIPEAARAMAAAIVITRSESSQLHLPNLRARPYDFDPLIRDRLLANTMVPASWYLQAQRFRRWHRRQLLKLFESVDVILAPATPCPAHLIGEETITLNSSKVPARAAAGLLTAPLSLVGPPVICAPMGMLAGLPVGLQIIAAPWREDLCFRVARTLERKEIAKFVVAKEIRIKGDSGQPSPC